MTRELERLAVILGALSIAGCGDDSSPANADASAADVAADTTKHDSGVVTNPDAGGMTPMTVACGNTMCSPPMSALGGLGGGGLPGGGGGGMAGGMAGGLGGALALSACCLSDGGCGAGLGALPIGGGGGDGGPTCLDTSAGTPDPTCPSMNVVIINLAGCCSNAHVCGVDLSIAGLGCNSPSLFGALLGMGDAGAPKPCGVDAGVVVDAATDGEAGAADGGDSGSGDAGAADSGGADSGSQDAAHD